MTTKELAVKAAEFLKKAIESNSMRMPRKHLQKIIYERPVTIDDWFYDYEINPILMHLAKREMEKRKDYFEHNKFKGQGHQIRFYDSAQFIETVTHPKDTWIEDENEYKAFWSALEQAVKGGKG